MVEDAPHLAGIFGRGILLDMLGRKRSATSPKLRALAASCAAASAARFSCSRRSSTGLRPSRARVIDALARSRASATDGVSAIVPSVSMTALPPTRYIASQVRRLRGVIRSPKPGSCVSHQVTGLSAGAVSLSAAAWVSLVRFGWG